jgi:D-arabinose 1-dehydrogenase
MNQDDSFNKFDPHYTSTNPNPPPGLPPSVLNFPPDFGQLPPPPTLPPLFSLGLPDPSGLFPQPNPPSALNPTSAIFRPKPKKLSDILPPLVFGTATFHSKYNDPRGLDTKRLIRAALDVGIRAFDSSPYYGEAQQFLGEALCAAEGDYERSEYVLTTKVGRYEDNDEPNIFDYRKKTVSWSVQESLRWLGTDYLDLVFCHDVEFVTEDEVLEAVRELRRIRDEKKTVRFIGISGYPVDVLCHLAEKVLEETGEPLDAVMSYANFTLQNTRLYFEGLERLQKAEVDCVLNASLLGMGLIRSKGPPVGTQGNWHPAPEPLINFMLETAIEFKAQYGERIEDIALYTTLLDWMRNGKEFGSWREPIKGERAWHEERHPLFIPRSRLGISVIGVSDVNELQATMQICRSIFNRKDMHELRGTRRGFYNNDQLWDSRKMGKLSNLAEKFRQCLKEFSNGEYVDYTWPSPPEGFVRGKVRSVEPEDLWPNIKPESKEPEIKEPEIKEPEIKEPEIKEPEIKEPEIKEPEIKEPENKEPENKEPKGKERANKEPECPQNALKD